MMRRNDDADRHLQMNDRPNGTDRQVKLAGPIDLAGFRAEVGLLLAHQVPPDAVHWQPDSAGNPAETQAPQASRPRNVARATHAIIPASFSRLCEFVVLHRDADRFSLLYRLLWRLVHEPGLRGDADDADMLRAQHMAHAVRRDIHKLKTSLAFRTLHDADGHAVQLACHETTHHVVETAALALAKRLPAPHWILLTPDCSVRCEAGRLAFGRGVVAADLPPADASDAQWLACCDRLVAPRQQPQALDRHPDAPSP